MIVFPRDIPPTPRGGHFPAWEAPDQLAADLYATDFYGGAGGSIHDVPFAGRRLIGISGRAGGYVDSIQLHFDAGPPSPRFGGQGGSEYLIVPPQPNLVVIGLYGRSGAKIDRIGLLYRYRLA